MTQIRTASTAGEIEAIRSLFAEYAASLPVDLSYQNFDAEVAGLPGSYGPPEGRLFLAEVAGVVAGCVAIRRRNREVCEMKRLYVRPQQQGAGIGRQLVLAAIDAALSLGYQEMWLDTLPTMSSAQRLYAELGFQRIEAYGSAHAPGTRFYGLRLVSQSIRTCS